MKVIPRQILKDVEAYVSMLYKDSDITNLLYHNLEHTKKVVARINEIADYYNLDEQDIIVLNIAGWFHDTGHLYTTPAGHEARSAEEAVRWLDSREEYDGLGKKLHDLIMVTTLDAEPHDICQQIIKDADTYELGTKNFKENDKLLKEEMRLRNLITQVSQWRENTLQLLLKHKFYTDYCASALNERKQKNIDWIKKKIGKKTPGNTAATLVTEPKKPDKEETKLQNNIMTKGIQTMLRLASENHMRLSDMADSKANILISVNAIIISVILSILLRKIETDVYLTIPTFLFLLCSVVTIVLAIIATRPKITKGSFTRQDVIERRTNLLFFGNFYKSTLEDYKWGMKTMMSDSDYLYSALIDDIYYMGKVLGVKYKLVRLAYIIFMIGILVSVVAFSLAIALHDVDKSITVTNATRSPF